MHSAWAYLLAKQALYVLSYGPIEFSLWPAEIPFCKQNDLSHSASRAHFFIMANERSDTMAAGRGVVIPPIVGDIAPSIDSFRRHLRASNAAPRTIMTYLEGATQLADFLASHGMPTDVDGIRREHVEAFLVDLLARFTSATADNRYRCLKGMHTNSHSVSHNRRAWGIWSLKLKHCVLDIAFALPLCPGLPVFVLLFFLFFLLWFLSF